MRCVTRILLSQRPNRPFPVTERRLANLARLAELMVFYCERAASFSNDVGYQDEGYFDALVHMFEQALGVTHQLSAGDRDALIVRLDRVRTISHNLGYGVGDAMDSLLVNYIGT